MAKVTVTLQIDEEVLAGLEAVVQRPEFQGHRFENGEQVTVPLYASGKDFLARRVFFDGLNSIAGLIPAVAVKQQAIAKEQAAIQAMLTPEVS